MRALITVILFNFAFGFDAINLYKVQKAYENKEFNKSLEYLDKVKEFNDETLIKKANIYYRLKHYKEAISLYKEINKAKYNFLKLYNIANSYMALKDYKEAIIYYQEALKFKDSQRAKNNLKIAKKLYKKDEELKKRLNYKEPQSEDKSQGLCKLFRGINPAFIEDDKRGFYGSLAKYKDNFKINSNIAKSNRDENDIKIDTKSNKTVKKELKKDENLSKDIELRWDSKLQNLSDEALLVPLEEKR